jgi:hypothetical protein
MRFWQARRIIKTAAKYGRVHLDVTLARSIVLIPSVEFGVS